MEQEPYIGFVQRDRAKYGFLSNFYMCTIKYKGISFKSVEHAYQWSKTDDPQFQEDIIKCVTPARTKYFGKRCPLREDWEDVKISIMRELVEIKFKDRGLNLQLEATGNIKLVEDAAWDKFWGAGRDGVGENWLGRILMDERAKIFAEDPTEGGVRS